MQPGGGVGLVHAVPEVGRSLWDPDAEERVNGGAANALGDDAGRGSETDTLAGLQTDVHGGVICPWRDESCVWLLAGRSGRSQVTMLLTVT